MIPIKYREIIDLPHYQSKTRPKMSRVERAAQFSPFSALVGYDDIIDETNRRTETEFDYGDDTKAELDRKLAILEEHIKDNPEIVVTYFVADKKKEGGAYYQEIKRVKRIDPTLKKIHFTDKTELPMQVVSDMQGDIFEKNL